jgi:hypothetical protein
MTRDELEFQISQYVDGTLSTGETTALEKTLASSEKARELLNEYSRLQKHLNSAMPLPIIQWDRLAAHLSNVVQAPQVAGRIGFASGRFRLAIAASILIIITVGLFFHPRRSPKTNSEEPIAIIVGPQAEAAIGPVIQQITVGPSPALAARGDSWRYGEGVVTRPSHIELAGEVHPPTADSHIH